MIKAKIQSQPRRASEAPIAVIDELTRFGAERDVAVRAPQRSLADPEIRFGRNAESGVSAEFHQQRITERRERRAIERFRFRDVGYG